MAKVLVAIRPQDADLMHRVFGDEIDVISCMTLAEAQAALDTQPAMIACGVHFDDGRMFDLLKLVKAHPQFSDIPFWGVLRDDGLLSSAITRGIRTAMKSMGANGLVKLPQPQPADDGDAGYRQLRTAIQQSLAGKE